MNYERMQSDFVGLYAPNLIYHSIFTPPIKMEPTFIQNPNTSSDDSFNEDHQMPLDNSPGSYTTMVRQVKIFWNTFILFVKILSIPGLS